VKEVYGEKWAKGYPIKYITESVLRWQISENIFRRNWQ
jgi:ribonuclease HII